MNDNKMIELRKQIDEYNMKIMQLLNERAKIAVLIGKEKEKMGLEKYDVKREEEILKRLKFLNEGPLTDEMICDVFRSVFSTNLELQLMNSKE